MDLPAPEVLTSSPSLFRRMQRDAIPIPGLTKNAFTLTFLFPEPSLWLSTQVQLEANSFPNIFITHSATVFEGLYIQFSPAPPPAFAFPLVPGGRTRREKRMEGRESAYVTKVRRIWATCFTEERIAVYSCRVVLLVSVYWKNLELLF